MASITENYSTKTGDLLSFRLRADLGRDANGKQIVKTKTIKVNPKLTPAKARKAAQKEADEWESNLRAGLVPTDEKTFRQFVEQDFFEIHVHSGQLKASTIAFYQNMAPRAIEFFGNTPLTKICSTDIERFLKNLRTVIQDNGQPLSDSTIRHHYSFMKILFNFAEQHDLLIRNPMLKVKPPKAEKKPVEFFTQQEAQVFLDELKSAPLQWQVIMNTLIQTGLRRGEACGLQWADISFANATLTIKRNVVYTPETGVVIGSPKTKSALRTIPLNESLLILLRSWQKEQACGGTLLPSAFVFSDPFAPYAPVRPDRVTRWLRRFEQSHNLRELSPHDLRHSCASLLLSGGASLKGVQEILGHSESSTTLDFYAGISKEDLRGETEKLKKVLGL